MKLLPFILIVLLLIIAILFVIKFILDINKDLYNDIKSVKYTGDYKIPKIIHQIWLQGYDSLDSNIKKVITENLKMNSEWDYKFYDYEKIDKYIKEHESQYVYNAFQKINPKYGAVVSDFFRYIIMYHEGGVYMDIKCKTNIPLDDWVHKNKLLISLFGNYEEFNQLLVSKYYFNCTEKYKSQVAQFFLIFPKKFTILRLLINTIVKNIYNYKDNSYLKLILGNKIYNNYNIFKLTGPWIYSKILGPYICNNKKDIILFKHNGIVSIFNGYILYDGTNGEYHKKQHTNKKHYLDLKEKIIL